MSERPLEYTNLEKDLGVHVNGKLSWTEHCEILYSKASQKLGLLIRTCSFVPNLRKRRSLYLSLVRSQFEHCAIIWRPLNKSTLDKLDALQKRALKWVINKPYDSLTNLGDYYKVCKQVNILPFSPRFDYKDLMFFHSVYYSYSTTRFPSYLAKFTQSRLRTSHYDSLSIVSDIQPRVPQNLSTDRSNMGIAKSYFYRAHLLWNALPFEIRDIGAPSKFKVALLDHLWGNVSETIKQEFAF